MSREKVLEALRMITVEGIPPWWKAESVPVPGRASSRKVGTQELIRTFQRSLEAVQGEFLEADDPGDVSRIIDRDILGGKRGTVLAEPSPSLRELLAGSRPRFDFCKPDTGRKTLAKVDVGIVEARILVAETGSAVVGSGYPGSRSLSLLPPTTILVASADSLVPDIETAAAETAGLGNAVWITGPSRTADIEKVLVLGVHGPERLVVLLYHSPT